MNADSFCHKVLSAFIRVHLWFQKIDCFPWLKAGAHNDDILKMKYLRRLKLFQSLS